MGLDGKGLATLARLAEAFDVCGKLGPDAPMLVLRVASDAVFSGPLQESAIVDRLVADLRSIFQGPVLVVPHDWTQEQIDVEAVRLAVAEEREACARDVEAFAADGEDFVSVERVVDVIRARGSK